MDIMELEKAFRELSQKLDKVIVQQMETQSELSKLKAILTGNGVDKGAIRRLHDRIDGVENKIRIVENKLWGVAVGLLTLLAGILLKFHFLK